MQTVDINIDELRPYEKNAKIHSPKQVEQIAASLLEFGWRQPLVVTADKVVVVGHGRLAEAKIARKTDPAFSHAPCLIADDLTDEQIKAYRLADNKLNESPWDPQLTEEELASFTEIDMSAFGFDLSELAAREEKVVEDKYQRDDTENITIKQGDVYALGEHRVMCGDSSDVKDIEALCCGRRAKLLLTDPPYGIDADKGVGGYGSAPETAKVYFDEWDRASPSKEHLSTIIHAAEEAIIFGGNYLAYKLPPGGRWICWDKVGSIEFHNPYSDCELAWTNLPGAAVKKYTCIQQGFICDEKEERLHPTQKPVKLLGAIVSDVTSPGDIVIDLFGGSGSSLIACEQLGRVCYTMELDPKYVHIIIKRWEQFTGQKAEKLN